MTQITLQKLYELIENNCPYTDLNFNEFNPKKTSEPVKSQLYDIYQQLTINTNKTNLLKLEQNQTKNIDQPHILKMLNNNSSYYMGMDNNDSLLKSILCIIDNNLLFDKYLNLDKYCITLRNKLGMELDKNKYFQKFGYRKQKYNKQNMMDTLLNGKPINNDIIHYIADYFDINIISINSEYPNNYKYLNEYSDERGNCYVLNFNNNYNPILNINNDHIVYKK